MTGDYPDVMKQFITGNRLPTFTDDEKTMLKGSFDFFGLNHYYSRYIHFTNEPGIDYSNDHRCWDTTTNKYGHVIGPSYLGWL